MLHYFVKVAEIALSLMHSVSYLFRNQPIKESPKLSKGTGFSRISIKRVSGVISSSFRLPSVSNDQPNSVFYTGMSGKCHSNFELSAKTSICQLVQTNQFSLCLCIDNRRWCKC